MAFTYQLIWIVENGAIYKISKFECHHFQIQGSGEYVEGLYIRYRDLSGGAQQFNMATVLNTDVNSYTLANLRKYTKYQVFLVPFFKTIDGQPSNSMEVQTLEDGRFL